MVAVSGDEISSHMLVGNGVKVHVIAAGESWPVKEVRHQGRLGGSHCLRQAASAAPHRVRSGQEI
jgi:hypothetical protein